MSATATDYEALDMRGIPSRFYDGIPRVPFEWQRTIMSARRNCDGLRILWDPFTKQWALVIKSVGSLPRFGGRESRLDGWEVVTRFDPKMNAEQMAANLRGFLDWQEYGSVEKCVDAQEKIVADAQAKKHAERDERMGALWDDYTGDGRTHSIPGVDPGHQDIGEAIRRDTAKLLDQTSRAHAHTKVTKSGGVPTDLPEGCPVVAVPKGGA